jgi:hypothetical protein
MNLGPRAVVSSVLVAVTVVGAGVALAHAARQAPASLGRCTMALPATETTVEVQIPDAADFCELVSQGLAAEVFYAPMLVTPDRLWHYPDAALSCRLRYRQTPGRITVHNSPAACQWLLGLSPGWHPQAVLLRVHPLRAKRISACSGRCAWEDSNLRPTVFETRTKSPCLQHICL